MLRRALCRRLAALARFVQAGLWLCTTTQLATIRLQMRLRFLRTTLRFQRAHRLRQYRDMGV